MVIEILKETRVNSNFTDDKMSCRRYIYRIFVSFLGFWTLELDWFPVQFIWDCVGVSGYVSDKILACLLGKNESKKPYDFPILERCKNAGVGSRFLLLLICRLIIFEE